MKEKKELDRVVQKMREQIERAHKVKRLKIPPAKKERQTR